MAGVGKSVGGRGRHAPDDDHRRGVEDVLARGPAVDVLGGVAADGGAQLIDEPDHRNTTQFGGGGNGDGIDAVEPACRSDRFCGITGDLTDGGLGSGERRLDVELRLQPRRRRRRFSDRAAGDEMVERADAEQRSGRAADHWRWPSPEIRAVDVLHVISRSRP